jgi:hypothetical protein
VAKGFNVTRDSRTVERGENMTFDIKVIFRLVRNQGLQCIVLTISACSGYCPKTSDTEKFLYLVAPDYRT